MGEETGREANQEIGVPRGEPIGELMGVPNADDLQFRWMVPDAEMRMAGEESRTITGYAAVFDSEAKLWGDTTEVIRRGAFDSTDLSKVVCLFNHSYDQMLASVAGGTLRLGVDERGLQFEADVARTAMGDQVIELVRRGDLQGCSFAFWVKRDQWTNMGGGQMLRELLDISAIDDVGPVVRPAYEATSVALRSYYESQLPTAEPAPRARLNNDWRQYVAAIKETHNA